MSTTIAGAALAMAQARQGTGQEVDAFHETARLSGVDANTFTLALARACIEAGRRDEFNSLANAQAREDALR